MKRGLTCLVTAAVLLVSISAQAEAVVGTGNGNSGGSVSQDVSKDQPVAKESPIPNEEDTKEIETSENQDSTEPKNPENTVAPTETPTETPKPGNSNGILETENEQQSSSGQEAGQEKQPLPSETPLITPEPVPEAEAENQLSGTFKLAGVQELAAGANVFDWLNPDHYPQYTDAFAAGISLGSADTPILIQTAAQLVEFAQTVNGTAAVDKTAGTVAENNRTFSGLYVNLSPLENGEISLSSYDGTQQGSGELNVWKPIGYRPGDETVRFEGTFDGCGYAVTDMGFSDHYLVADSDGNYDTCYGLFGRIGELGVVRNLRVDRIHYEISNKASYLEAVGGVAAYNAGQIENVDLHEPKIEVTGKAENLRAVGGAVAVNTGTVSHAVISGGEMRLNGGFYAGGVIGEQSAGLVENSIFQGTITDEMQTVALWIGGIAGRLDGGEAQKNITAAQILRPFAVLIPKAKADDGWIGGIAGQLSGSAAIRESFVLGSLEAVNFAATLVGRMDAGAVENCFSAMSISSSFTYVGTNTSGANKQLAKTAGFIGELKGGAVKNSYYAGSVMMPHIGALSAQTGGAWDGGVYYDVQSVPNAPFGDSSDSPYGNGVPAAELSTRLTEANAAWTVSGTDYPRLAWCEGLSEANDYEKLAKNLLKIATKPWLPNGGIFETAYQMRDGAEVDAVDISDVYNDGSVPAASQISRSDYPAVYAEGTVPGSVWTQTVQFAIAGQSYTVSWQRKTLYSYSQSEVLSLTDGNINRFLDYVLQAGGAVLGSVFSLGEDITQVLTVKQQADTASSYFCGTLDGAGKAVNSVVFTEGGSALLGNGYYALVRNLTFRALSAGEKNSPIPIRALNFGMLFNETHESALDAVTVDQLKLYLNQTGVSHSIGGLVGRNVMGESRFSNVHVGKLESVIGDRSQKKDNQGAGSVGGFLGTGEGTGTELVENCTIGDLQVTLDLQQSKYKGGFGGLIGEAAGRPTVTGCDIRGRFEWIKVAGSSQARYLAGMIGYMNAGSIDGCTFTGILAGENVGGFAGYTDGQPTIQNSFFTGEIKGWYRSGSSFYAGGIVGFLSNNGNISNCGTLGTVTGDVGNGFLGGIAGWSRSGNYRNVYSRMNLSTEDSGNIAGGLIGGQSGSLNLAASYYAGQIHGNGSHGGILGQAENIKQNIGAGNCFDKNLTGNLKTVSEVKGSLENPYPFLGVETDQVTIEKLSGGKIGSAVTPLFAEGTQDTYPELNAHLGKPYSALSVKKHIKLLSPEEYLEGMKSGGIQTVNTAGSRENVQVHRFDVDQTSLELLEETVVGSGEFVVTGNAGGNTVVVSYPDLLIQGESGVESLTLTYHYVVRPFEYGDGTEENPYVIYSLNVLKDFRDYLNKGRDKDSLHYIMARPLTSGDVENGSNFGVSPEGYLLDAAGGYLFKIAGSQAVALTDPTPDARYLPQTFDLSELDGNLDTVGDEWLPAMYLNGTLYGNGSEIRNMTCTVGYQTEAGDSSDYYSGFFGIINASGTVENLIIRDAVIGTASPYGGKMGALAGMSRSSTAGGITHITVKGARIQNGDRGYAGGLIGYQYTMGPSVIADCTVIAELSSDSAYESAAGGLIGYQYSTGLRMERCASYGTIEGSQFIGGLVGVINSENYSQNFADCAAVMDLKLGELAGRISVAGGLIGTSEPAMTAENYHLRNSFYGGKIQASTTAKVGGLVGRAANVYDVNAAAGVEVLEYNTAAGIYEAHLAEAKAQAEKQLGEVLEGCYFNYDVNPYEACGVTMRMYYRQYTPAETIEWKTVDTGAEMEIIRLGKSSTYRMSQNDSAQNPIRVQTGWDSTIWEFTDGLYPRLAHTQTLAEDIRDSVEFYSIAVHYTPAGIHGSNQYANSFIRFQDAVLIQQTGNTASAVVFTDNQKMVAATGNETDRLCSYALSYSKNGRDYLRNLTFIPCTDSTGRADFSWYLANKDGMWVTKDADSIWPHTVYSADQLAGLGLMTNQDQDSAVSDYGVIDGYLCDGQGLYLPMLSSGNRVDSYFDGLVSPDPARNLSAEIALGNDVDASVYRQEQEDGSLKMGFAPLGRTAAHSFNYGFNGFGHHISRLYLGGVDSTDTSMGLFGYLSDGGRVRNLGISSGNMVLSEAVSDAGSLAGRIENAELENCYSSMSIEGTTASAVIGGLAGTVVNSRLEGSFFTGYIYNIGLMSKAGGLVGMIKGGSLRSSYAAGYLQAGTASSIADTVDGAEIADCYADYQACGSSLKLIRVGAVEEGVKAVSTRQLTATVDGASPADLTLGQGWTYFQGYYPIPSAFAEYASDFENAEKACTVPVYLTSHARSVTKGKVELSEANLSEIIKRFGEDSTASVTWTVKGKEFEKTNSGTILMNVSIGETYRPIVMSLKCWYDDPVDGVYTITTPTELAEFAAIVNGTLTSDTNPNGAHTHNAGAADSFEGKTVRLGANIDMTELKSYDAYAGGWIPAGVGEHPFLGTFDGAGYLISNLEITKANSDGYLGLFGKADGNARILNLGIASGSLTVKEGQTAGTIIGCLTGNAAIDSCFSSAGITGGGTVGGLAGRVEAGASIIKSFHMGSIQKSGIAGGIAGHNRGTLSDCYNTGMIREAGTAGGITGQNDGTVQNCYQASYLTGTVVAAIAGAGKAPVNSYYDRKLSGVLEGEGSGTPVDTESLVAMSNTLGAAWTEAQSSLQYPQLVSIRDQSLFLKEASELSAGILSFGNIGGMYNNFSSFTMDGMTSQGSRILPEDQANLLSFTQEGTHWHAASSGMGDTILMNRLNIQGIELSHSYYLYVQLTLTIRYRFDYSELLADAEKNGYKNTGYNAQTTSRTREEWLAQSTGTVFTIGSYQEFLYFVDYVNQKNPTKGTTFRLTHDIQVPEGASAIAPIGSAETPFEGTFQGGCYTIDGLTVSAMDAVGLFGEIGTDGTVKDLELLRYTVIGGKSGQGAGTALTAGGIAARNRGVILNTGIGSGELNLYGMNRPVQVGYLVGDNDGGIVRGSYFIQKNVTDPNSFGLNLNDEVASRNCTGGGLAGRNRNNGLIAGCYYNSNVQTYSGLTALVGDNSGGRLRYSYFSCTGEGTAFTTAYMEDGTAVPIDAYFVKTSEMKTQTFVDWLNCDLYAGTYAVDTDQSHNQGLPYLFNRVLIQYDLDRYFDGSPNVMLAVNNLSNKEENNSYMRGIMSHNGFIYPYYDVVLFNERIQVRMDYLPDTLDYTVTGVSMSDSYGRADLEREGTTVTSKAMENMAAGPCEFRSSEFLSGTNRIVLDIRLTPQLAKEKPWGVFRKNAVGRLNGS